MVNFVPFIGKSHITQMSHLWGLYFSCTTLIWFCKPVLRNEKYLHKRHSYLVDFTWKESFFDDKQDRTHLPILNFPAKVPIFQWCRFSQLRSKTVSIFLKKLALCALDWGWNGSNYVRMFGQMFNFVSFIGKSHITDVTLMRSVLFMYNFNMILQTRFSKWKIFAQMTFVSCRFHVDSVFVDFLFVRLQTWKITLITFEFSRQSFMHSSNMSI